MSILVLILYLSKSNVKYKTKYKKIYDRNIEYNINKIDKNIDFLKKVKLFALIRANRYILESDDSIIVYLSPIINKGKIDFDDLMIKNKSNQNFDSLYYYNFSLFYFNLFDELNIKYMSTKTIFNEKNTKYLFHTNLYDSSFVKLERVGANIFGIEVKKECNYFKTYNLLYFNQRDLNDSIIEQTLSRFNVDKMYMINKNWYYYKKWESERN